MASWSPLQVNMWLNGDPFSIHTVCGTVEWMGQTTQVHHERGARSLHVICGASLQKQKQVHPRILGMNLSQPELSAIDRPPRVRWPDKRNSIHAARGACAQSPGSLIWVFLYQPLSNSSKDKAPHRRWVLASLTRTPNLREWIGTSYQSTSPNATNIAMFRPNMAGHPFPTLAPMADQRYSFRFTAPLTAVWFRATQRTTELCCPPPYMDPVSFIIETMNRANEARLCAPPRLWKDLLSYHQIGEGMLNPKTGSPLDVTATFSRFDNEPFPCMETDQEYGGLGSTFAVLERATAIDHALRSDPFPGLTWPAFFDQFA